MKSQKQIVLAHLQQHGSITQLKAMQKYKIMRLSERCRELEDEGVQLKRTTHKAKSAEHIPGAAGRYTRYHLKDIKQR